MEERQNDKIVSNTFIEFQPINAVGGAITTPQKPPTQMPEKPKGPKNPPNSDGGPGTTPGRGDRRPGVERGPSKSTSPFNNPIG